MINRPLAVAVIALLASCGTSSSSGATSGSGTGSGSTSGGTSSGTSSGSSGTTGGGTTFSCQYDSSTESTFCSTCTGVQECDTFFGPALTMSSLALAKSSCQGQMAPTTPASCPFITTAGNRTGCCEYPYSYGGTENSCFYGAGADTATLTQECNSTPGGVWTPD